MIAKMEKSSTTSETLRYNESKTALLQVDYSGHSIVIIARFLRCKAVGASFLNLGWFVLQLVKVVVESCMSC